jgi:hypothetical protein
MKKPISMPHNLKIQGIPMILKSMLQILQNYILPDFMLTSGKQGNI